MVAYLLGTASEDERASVEAEFFADDGTFDELAAIETDLIDAYVNGELSPDEREAFEKRFLASDAGRARVMLARQLLDRGRHRSRLHLYAVAAAAVILIAAAVAVKRVPPASVPGPASLPPTAAETPVASVTPVALTLRPGLTRSPAAGASLRVPQTGSVRIRLEHDGPAYPSYRVLVRSAEGRAIWTSNDLGSEAKASPSILIDIPAALLFPDDYVILLSGIRAGLANDVADYTFRVLRP